MEFKFSEYTTKKLKPVFQLVGVDKKHYSLLTKILSLLGTLKGRRYGKKQIEKFLKPIPKEYMTSLNEYLKEIFCSHHPESISGSITTNLIILFKTKGDLNQMTFSSMLKKCFFTHSGDHNYMSRKECELFAKDFYFFLVNDKEFDELQINEMIDECIKDEKIQYDEICKYYNNEDDSSEDDEAEKKIDILKVKDEDLKGGGDGVAEKKNEVKKEDVSEENEKKDGDEKKINNDVEKSDVVETLNDADVASDNDIKNNVVKVVSQNDPPLEPCVDEKKDVVVNEDPVVVEEVKSNSNEKITTPLKKNISVIDNKKETL